jgi:hypothetical protein
MRKRLDYVTDELGQFVYIWVCAFSTVRGFVDRVSVCIDIRLCLQETQECLRQLAGKFS